MADTNNEATSPAPAALVVHGIPVGVPVPVDAELDPDSDNPISNKAVSEKFDEINTHLSVTSGTITSGYALGTPTVKKCANRVSIDLKCRFDNGLTPQTYVEMATISTNSMIPTVAKFFTVPCVAINEGNLLTVGLAKISTTGKIFVKVSTTTGNYTEVYINCDYIVD